MNQYFVLVAPLAILIFSICGMDDSFGARSARQQSAIYSHSSGVVNKYDQGYRMERPTRVACNINGDLYLLQPGQEALPGEQEKIYPRGEHQSSGILQNHFFHSSIE